MSEPLFDGTRSTRHFRPVYLGSHALPPIFDPRFDSIDSSG